MRCVPTAIAATGLVLALACPLAACGGSDHEPARGDGANGAQPVPSPDRRIAVWRRAVPAAVLRGARTRSGERRGTPLSAHWLARDGSVDDSDPRGRVVAWPAPVSLLAGGAQAFRVRMPAPPNRVDVRVFAGAVDDAGVPRSAPRLIACSPHGSRGGCRYAFDGRGIDVELRRPARHPIARVVLYTRWYVPYAQRPSASKSNPTVSASWGFVVATRRSA
jgi:hypothetical protein